ncbi:glycine cleavage H-protein [Sulfobacillus acidophilus TPY]|uniref:Glycine cleavage system H protein n=1 Tax=Sulfobacillus acidophilus (strain ATCC 700253 / DSM 10332 / NAL) TaxID=679936 RepID=G8TWI9_SULAD|nr:glycine cleavage H-protein [Sulfobacillus acidophilus TPY]AEW04887.1 Glycine cleavage system H protein [Sulfobacillus acidophilus DSM 10332]
MAYVLGCELPEGLWFQVAQDVWVKPLEDGSVRVGMTDPAQTRAGRLLTMQVRVGKTVAVGKNLATVESGKWVGPIPAPLPGKIVEANPVVLNNPNIINRDPYGEGWVLRLQPTVTFDQWESMGLVTGPVAVEQYREKLKAENLTCLRCADVIEED